MYIFFLYIYIYIKFSIKKIMIFIILIIVIICIGSAYILWTQPIREHARVHDPAGHPLSLIHI